MPALSHLARVETVLVLSLFVSVIAYQLLTGRIEMRGMLDSKPQGTFDPGRLQALVISLVICGLLLGSLAKQQDQLSLPSIALLYLFGGSQGVYVVRKLLQTRTFLKGE